MNVKITKPLTDNWFEVRAFDTDELLQVTSTFERALEYIALMGYLLIQFTQGERKQS